MSEQQTTSFENRCSILAELWLNYRDDEEFGEYIEYNDLGLPLAYLIDSNIVATTTEAEKFINEAWAMLLDALEVTDVGWDNLDNLLEGIPSIEE